MSTEKPHYFGKSVADLIERHHQKKVGTIKLWSTRSEKKKEYSYKDIQQASGRRSSFLKERDIEPHDRVILWAPNSPQWVISYLAILRAGAVVVPFDIKADMGFLDRVIMATEPRMIIMGNGQKDQLSAKSSVPILDIEQVDKISGQTDDPIKIDTSSDDLAEIVFTSGTTGNPKGVMLTHGNVLSNIESISRVVQLKSTDKLLSVLPLSHMFETTVGLLTPLFFGSGITYVDTILPRSIMQTLREEGITCMAVAPEVLQRFKQGIKVQISQEGKDLQFNLAHKISSLMPLPLRRQVFKSLHQRMGGNFNFFVCGGAKLDSKLADFWEGLGIKIIQGYGATEAAPVISCDSMVLRNHNFVGYPLPGVDVKVSGEGEILVSGTNVMQGYWRNPEATGDALKDGWYHTGDIGTLDRGRLKLMGRKNDMIVLPNGFNVHPADVEQALTSQDGNATLLREAVVFYEEYLVKGEPRGRLRAVMLVTDSTVNERIIKNLVSSANEKLATHQRIGVFTIWPNEDFPRTSTRKAKRAEIIKSLTYSL